MEMLLKQDHVSFFSCVLDRFVEDSFTADVVVPDSLEDVSEILTADGDFCLWRLDLNSGTAEAEGEWNGRISYSPDSADLLLQFPVSVGVRLRMLDDRIEPELRPFAQFRVTDVSVQMMNSRKIRLKVRVSMHLEGYAANSIELTSGVETQSKGLFLKSSALCFSSVREVYEQVFTAGEQMRLRATPENRVLLACHSDIRADPPLQSGERVILHGKVLTTVLYQTEEQRLPTSETVETPFSQLLDLDGIQDQDVLYCQTQLTSAEVTLRDADLLETEFHIVVQTKCLREQQMSCISDAYSVSNPVSLQSESLALELVRKTDPVHFSAASDSPMDRSLQMLWSVPGIRSLKQNGDVASGVLEVSAMLSDPEGHLIQKHTEMSFEQKLPSEAQLLNVEMLQVSQLPDARLQVSGNLLIQIVEALNPSQITCMQLSEEQGMTTSEKPSVFLLPKSDSMDLWEIAKKYGSSITAIQSANDLPERETSSEYLLVPRIIC